MAALTAGVGHLVEALLQGGLAAFPMDAGWVVACRPDRPGMVAHLARLSLDGGPVPGRAGDNHAIDDHPPGVALAFASWNEARLFVAPSGAADALAGRLLPGALALRLDPADASLAHLSGGPLEVHVPAHEVAQRLLREIGPLAFAVLPGPSGDHTASDEVAAFMAATSLPDVAVLARTTCRRGSAPLLAVGPGGVRVARPGRASHAQLQAVVDAVLGAPGQQPAPDLPGVRA